MTVRDANILVTCIRASKYYYKFVVQMRPIEEKVKHGMILYKQESDKLQKMYREVTELELVAA